MLPLVEVCDQSDVLGAFGVEMFGCQTNFIFSRGRGIHMDLAIGGGLQLIKRICIRGLCRDLAFGRGVYQLNDL